MLDASSVFLNLSEGENIQFLSNYVLMATSRRQ